MTIETDEVRAVEALMPTAEGALMVAAPPAPPVIQEGPGALLSAIVGLAKDPSVDVAKLQALLTMQERMEDRQAEREFAAALRIVQGLIPPIEKNGTITLIRDGVDKGSIPFARWEDMAAILNPIMAEHGFTLSYDTQAREGGGAVGISTLRHVSGCSKTASISLPLDTGPGRNNLQAMGSTISYGRRYTAEMLFNMVRKGTDDDGKAAGIKYITEDDAEKLRAKLKEAGRQENAFIPRMCSEAKSVTEVQVRDFTRVMGALQEIIDMRKAKP